MGWGANRMWGGAEELRGRTKWGDVRWCQGVRDGAQPRLGKCGMVLDNCGWTYMVVGLPGELLRGHGERWPRRDPRALPFHDKKK